MGVRVLCAIMVASTILQYHIVETVLRTRVSCILASYWTITSSINAHTVVVLQALHKLMLKL